MSRIFLLSPAHCGGRRAQLALSPRADFDLARQLRSERGAALGDVFTFVSGLYFRGKLAYATSFAAPPVREGAAAGGVHVITPDAGLQPPETLVTREMLIAYAASDVDPDNAAYRDPLERSARRLARAIGPDCEVVLLGSIASPKYVDVLIAIFQDQLRFPSAFVGRGDMSRGGLLLRQVAQACELEYVPVDGSARRGRSPPKLPPRRGDVAARFSRPTSA
jgi:hypothetical protein